MNKRNIILGIAALIFSAGSALASLMINPVFAHVVYASDPDNTTCTSVPRDCSQTGQFDCRVKIDNPAPASDISGVQLFLDGACSQPMTDATVANPDWIPSGGRTVISAEL